jgi:hypothetical protein
MEAKAGSNVYEYLGSEKRGMGVPPHVSDTSCDFVKKASPRMGKLTSISSVRWRMMRIWKYQKTYQDPLRMIKHRNLFVDLLKRFSQHLKQKGQSFLSFIPSLRNLVNGIFPSL